MQWSFFKNFLKFLGGFVVMSLSLGDTTSDWPNSVTEISNNLLDNGEVNGCKGVAISEFYKELIENKLQRKGGGALKNLELNLQIVALQEVQYKVQNPSQFVFTIYANDVSVLN